MSLGIYEVGAFTYQLSEDDARRLKAKPVAQKSAPVQPEQPVKKGEGKQDA